MAVDSLQNRLDQDLTTKYPMIVPASTSDVYLELRYCFCKGNCRQKHAIQTFFQGADGFWQHNCKYHSSEKSEYDASDKASTLRACVHKAFVMSGGGGYARW